MASILAVDDEPAIIELYAMMLRTNGHEVSTATDGKTAIRKIRRKRYDCVILDIMMPGMSGYDVMREIREIPTRADMPIIVVTAKHDPYGVKKELEHDAADHLVKPFFPSELERAIERALDQGVASRERRRIIANGADMYDSFIDLYAEARATNV